MDNKNAIDRMIGWTADRYHYARNSFTKYRTQPKAPPYLREELANVYGINLDWLNDYDDEQLQQLAVRISWVYSNVDRIAKEVSDAKLEVYKRGSNAKDIEHDFERLIESPNQFFGRMALFQYLIWSLMLCEDGAYWYLAPDSSNRNTIREIWPVQMNRLTPIKNQQQFISGYEYRVNGRKPYIIPSQYICRFFLPNPFDMWKSLTPLVAAKYAMDVYTGIASSQRSLFTEGGGIPLSIVTVDPNMGDPDFNAVRAQIQEDWKNEKRIAVARAGTIDVKAVGISNKDLEAISSINTNRDEIDSVFMGIPWRTPNFLGGEGIREANRQIRERVIHPLHTLISTQIQIHIMNLYYANGRDTSDYLVRFEDVRDRDRALAVQEHSVNWRAMTLNEARFQLGLPPYNDNRFDDMGNLLLHLSINPSYIQSLYGLDESNIRDPQKKPDGVGNLPDSASPERTTNMLVESGSDANVSLRSIDVDSAINEAIRTELKRYRTVLLRTFRKHESVVDKSFDTDIIPFDIMSSIKMQLVSVASESDINEIFAEHLK
jgi:phage portal protein BeeE